MQKPSGFLEELLGMVPLKSKGLCITPEGRESCCREGRAWRSKEKTKEPSIFTKMHDPQQHPALSDVILDRIGEVDHRPTYNAKNNEFSRHDSRPTAYLYEIIPEANWPGTFRIITP